MLPHLAANEQQVDALVRRHMPSRARPPNNLPLRSSPQAISIAFEVLSDEGEREQYDAMHRGSSSSGATRSSSSSSAGGGSAGRAPSERPPPDIHARLQLDFREAALGARRSVDVIVEDACCNCGGSGAAPGSMPPPCEMCKGRGEITKRQRLGALNAFNHETGKPLACRRWGCEWRESASGRPREQAAGLLPPAPPPAQPAADPQDATAYLSISPPHPQGTAISTSAAPSAAAGATKWRTPAAAAAALASRRSPVEWPCACRPEPRTAGGCAWQGREMWHAWAAPEAASCWSCT